LGRPTQRGEGLRLRHNGVDQGVVGAMNGRGDEGLDAPDAGEVEIIGGVRRQRM